MRERNIDGSEGAYIQYPKITRAQWAVLSALTDDRCKNLLENIDFLHDLAPETREFLMKADKKKVMQLNFVINAGAATRYTIIGIASLIATLAGIIAIFRFFADYVTLKLGK